MTETAFTLGTWKGFTTYRCTLCQFDCMDEDQARDHFRSHFEIRSAPKPETQESLLTIDGSGNIVAVVARQEYRD